MSAPAADASKTPGPLAKFAPFPKPFWVINGVELFERGAYYGMLSVLSVFIARELNFPVGATALLLAIQFPLLYFLPVLSGAMADKFGFKNLLVATFVILIAGYLTLSVANGFAMGLLGIVLYGVGAGLFKPMPAATVTDTTSEQDRNFGFAIYYWMINLGAFVAPIAMQQLFGGTFRSYFVVSAVLSALNLAICLFLWKDIRPAKPEIKVGTALKGVAELGRHPAFLVLILIYSGFWFMYAITTSYLQIYAFDQGILRADQIALLVPANALAILIVGPILSKITGKLPSLPLMIAGITVFCAGFLLIGFVPTLWALLGGILIYSVGEFLTHPSYLAYVSKIAPPDRVPIFLGFGFIAIGIGQFAGTFSGAFIYDRFAVQSANPQMFWVGIVAVGLMTVAALLVYNMVLARRLVPAADRPRRRPVVAPFAALVALLMIPALVVAAGMVPGTTPVSTAGSTPDPTDTFGSFAASIGQMATEGEATTVVFEVPEDTPSMGTITLLWTDEAPANPAARNAPDSFTLHVIAPNGTMVAMEENVANAPNGDGKIELEVEGLVPGNWTFNIEVQAGDQSVAAGPLAIPGVGGSADNGNTFELRIASREPAGEP